MVPLQEGVQPVLPSDYPRVLEVWEASVRATHHFVSEEDIHFFKPLVQAGIAQIPHLVCIRQAAGEVVGFAGIVDIRVEMLFIHPNWRGMGIGRSLLEYAVQRLGATELDVNEQNEQAFGFYRHLGFEVFGRSSFDSTGKPFPILHMRLESGLKSESNLRRPA